MMRPHPHINASHVDRAEELCGVAKLRDLYPAHEHEVERMKYTSQYFMCPTSVIHVCTTDTELKAAL